MRSILRKLNRNKNTETAIKRVFDFKGNKNVMDVFIANNKYGIYCVPEDCRTRNAVKKIMSGEVYEPDTIQYIREHSKGGDVIHAGTFFGDFLPGISSGIGENAVVWAYEPSRSNFNCAEITLKLNQLQNVRLFNKGLGNEPGKIDFFESDESGNPFGGGSSFAKTHLKPTSSVEVVRIDDEIPPERKVSIIQLDVEGFEEHAIKGAYETILRNKPTIILEDNEKFVDSDWFQENMIRIGYRFERKLHENTVWKFTG